MVYLKSVENVITLGKLIGLLFLFCLPLLSILFLKTKRNDLARPVMGTIFLVVVVVVVVLFSPPYTDYTKLPCKHCIAVKMLYSIIIAPFPTNKNAITLFALE